MFRRLGRLAVLLLLAACIQGEIIAASSGVSILFGKDTDARGTVVCHKDMGMCHTGFNAFFFITSPSPLDAIVGGANFSINGAHWQLGEHIISSGQYQNADVGGVADCPAGQWCQRFSWTHHANYQMTDTLPIQMCFRVWALDLSLRGHEPINSDTKCFYYTTPLEPDTREQLTGPSSAVFLTTPFSPRRPVFAHPFTLTPSAFALPDLSDHPSFQTLCSDDGCRSSVHVPLLVFPSNPLDQVSVYGMYSLDGDANWTPGGAASNQGIMHEAVGAVSHWSQLWSWDVSLSTPVGHAPPKQVCVRLFVTDRQTHMTAPAGEAFCRQFADLDKQAALSGPEVPVPEGLSHTVMALVEPRHAEVEVGSQHEAEDLEGTQEEQLDKKPFIEGIAALSGLFVAVALIATTYTRRREDEDARPRRQGEGDMQYRRNTGGVLGQLESGPSTPPIGQQTTLMNDVDDEPQYAFLGDGSG